MKFWSWKDAPMRFLTTYQNIGQFRLKRPTAVQYKHGFGRALARIMTLHPSKQGKEHYYPLLYRLNKFLRRIKFSFCSKMINQNKGACSAMWPWMDLSISISFPIRSTAILTSELSQCTEVN